MPPPLLFDISKIDQQRLQLDVEHIERVNPHRGAMRLLDGVIWANESLSQALAFKDVRADEFWVAGHIPGRPIFPGVLMIEAGAQLASLLFLLRMPDQKFLGFSGVDDVKFRGMVQPGDRLLLLGQEIEFRPRRCICAIQGLVNGQQVFESKITGMPM